MGHAYATLYVHLVWGTWGRRPLLGPELEKRVYGAIMKRGEELDCPVMAIGGMPDHVHVLAALSPAVSVAELVRQLKGWTSRLVSQSIEYGSPFRWQGGYSAFTLRKSDLPIVRHYIETQEAHHTAQTDIPDWEPPDLPLPKAASDGELSSS